MAKLYFGPERPPNLSEPEAEDVPRPTLPMVYAPPALARATWFQDWLELDRCSPREYDSDLSPEELLKQATEDFRSDRKNAWWDYHPKGQMRLETMWNQFAYFIGIIFEAAWRDPFPNGNDEDATGGGGSGDISDDEPNQNDPNRPPVYFGASISRGSSNDRGHGRGFARGRGGRGFGGPRRGRPFLFHPLGPKDRDAFIEATFGMSMEEKVNIRKAEQEKRRDRFFSDPEGTVRMFFSSWFIDRGLILSRRISELLPLIVRFYLRYLIQCDVFPDAHMRTGLLDALKATEQAMVELPHIQNFALSPGYRTWYDHATASDDDYEVPAEVLESGVKKVEEHDSAVGVPTIEPSTSETVPDVSSEIDHTTTSTDPNTTTDIPSSTESGLVVDPADPEVLVDLNSLAHELDELDPDAVIPAQADAVSGWDTLDDYWKMLPDGIKDTHVPGRVEKATRVVHSTKCSEAEMMNKGAVEAAADVGSNVGLSDEERVEEELRMKFGSAIMRPWGAYIDGRTYGPDIPRPVVDDLIDSSAIKLGTHNPLRDDIEVVLKDAEVKALMSGWGLQGTFVQLVRRSFTEGDEKVAPGRSPSKALWFMVGCKEVLPTYYVALED